MKIDIHVHTRKIKSGDANTRNVETEQFIEILKDTDVKILAITNHNHFDLAQYDEFTKEALGICQIWPGVELDVVENSKRAHLIVICNPTQSVQFDHTVSAVINETSPDTFTISLNEIAERFRALDCIYIAHYYAKKPDLDDDGIRVLTDLVANPKRILKEATNAISAGIYISHGHNSIYGSDVQNWTDYIQISKTLPELRLSVESFEQFCLLLEKDEATINTVLSKKIKERVKIKPFQADGILELDIYNDINIFFGSKGTGKTEILEALSKYFNAKGYKTAVYKSNDNHLNYTFDLKGNNFDCDVSEFGIDECLEEISLLKKASEGEVTSLNRYWIHFSIQETNKISRKLKIKNIIQEDEKESERDLAEISSVLVKIQSFKQYLLDTENIRDFVAEDLMENLASTIEAMISQIKIKAQDKLLENKSIHLLNSLVSTFLTEISKKTGLPAKPTKTGFAEYSSNRLKIEKASRHILSNIAKPIPAIDDYAGSLGEKGELRCKTNLILQNGAISDSHYSPVKRQKKTAQKAFANAVKSISDCIHSETLFGEISKLNEIEGIETMTSINDLLLMYRHFTLNASIYNPSNGESSMILLHKELTEEKDIYLIDEPEKSLGNDYINDVIVPLLKEKALLGKKVIVATHDANISIRTLPYNSVYRLHDKGEYFTLAGNPFSNSLKCILGVRPNLDWKEISMKTLEGGKEAFGERGKIYGN